jgi:putative membrane protein
MVRLLISAALRLGANFVGLLVADLILDDFRIEWQAYIVAVLIFTGVQLLIEPLLTKIALTNAPALRGSVALVSVLVGLIVTDILFDGFSISGLDTWAGATVIVWLGAMLAAFILPLIFIKKAVTDEDETKTVAPPKGSTWAP